MFDASSVFFKKKQEKHDATRAFCVGAAFVGAAFVGATFVGATTSNVAAGFERSSLFCERRIGAILAFATSTAANAILAFGKKQEKVG